MASPLANEPLVIFGIKITFLFVTDRFYSSLTWDEWVGKWEKLGEIGRILVALWGSIGSESWNKFWKYEIPYRARSQGAHWLWRLERLK